jgi:hypothetical protein
MKKTVSPNLNSKNFGLYLMQVGKGMAISALDLSQTNPWSRVTLSEYVNIQGVREWVRRYLRSLNQLPRGLPNKSMLAASKAGYVSKNI